MFPQQFVMVKQKTRQKIKKEKESNPNILLSDKEMLLVIPPLEKLFPTLKTSSAKNTSLQSKAERNLCYLLWEVISCRRTESTSSLLTLKTIFELTTNCKTKIASASLTESAALVFTEEERIAWLNMLSEEKARLLKTHALVLCAEGYGTHEQEEKALEEALKQQFKKEQENSISLSERTSPTEHIEEKYIRSLFDTLCSSIAILEKLSVSR